MKNKKIYRAGLIPYIVENNEIMMLFMKPSDSKYGGNLFQIAKGKLEKDESFEQAAIREAGEELGFTKLNMANSIYDLGNFLGRTQFFISEIKDKNMFGNFQFETAEVKWMSEKEFQQIGRPLHKPIVKAAIRKIKKLKT